MKIIFSLAEGLTLGGVTSLSVEMCRQLVSLGQSAALIEHSTAYGNPKLDFNLPHEVKLANCTDLQHPDDPQLDLAKYLPAYESLLPGILIPNWAYGTFAACASLAISQAENLRIIGYAHADKKTLRTKLNGLPPAVRNRVTLGNSVAPHELPEIWQAADISILVSEYEGTSLAMLESMAYGCVPVVTQVGGTTIIKPGVNGYCVPVGSVTEMAKIIKGLADDRERIAKIGLRAHATIGAQISYEQYVNWFLQMVRSLWLEAPRYWPVDRPLRLAQAPEPAPN